MFNAISSALSMTIDTYLKLKSSEVQRRKLGHKLFELHTQLGEVADIMEEVGTTISVLTEPGKYPPVAFDEYYSYPGRIRPPGYISILGSGPEGIQIEVRSIAEDGTERVHREYMQERDLLGAFLSDRIRRLDKAIRRLAALMEEGADPSWWFGHRAQPKLVRQLEVFNPDLAIQVADVWWTEGRFSQLLCYIGLQHELGRNVLRIMDTEVRPIELPMRGTVYDRLEEVQDKEYRLSDPEDVSSLLSTIDRSRQTVVSARDAVRSFMVENLSMTDIM